LSRSAMTVICFFSCVPNLVQISCINRWERSIFQTFDWWRHAN